MNNELKHYGVLGMKWGKRKGRSASVSIEKKRSGQTSKGAKAAKIALSVIGTASVATVATAAVTRRAARNYTVLGISKNVKF